jgi:hypothetical protein
VTRLDECGTPLDSACSYATNSCFATITLTKVFQDRQEALGLTANGDICYDVPKEPILRWYEVSIVMRNVDPEFFNIVSAEPMVLNDAVVPVAIGWDTVVGSAANSHFAFEFWTGTDSSGCDDGAVSYGYGLLPHVKQAVINVGEIGNAGVDFTITGITQVAQNWNFGPYNTLINESGVNEGLPGPELTTTDGIHKRFHWTELPPPDGVCGCSDLSPEFIVEPLVGAAAVERVATIPLGADGLPILPGVIDWGDLTADTIVTSGTTSNHTYVAGSYVATYRPTGFSSVTYTSQTITVS